MIQIRNVPPELHRKLKAKAAQAGLSLSDYLLRDVEQLAAQSTWEEILERLHRLPRINPPESAVEALRAEREGR